MRRPGFLGNLGDTWFGMNADAEEAANEDIYSSFLTTGSGAARSAGYQGARSRAQLREMEKLKQLDINAILRMLKN